MAPFVSICIPSYNRPEGIKYLLNSIDQTVENIEVVICEDRSPRREEIREVVSNFILQSKIKIKYIENEKNLGYDKNLRELIEYAEGEYIIYMGDDDAFGPKDALSEFIAFLQKHQTLGYVMKTHIFKHKDGEEELFKYFNEDQIFEPSEKTVSILFRRSVFISGFCFKRSYATPFLNDSFDGTLLYQIYLLAELCLKYPSGYSTIPLTVQSENRREKPMFGSSESEKELYEPGTITVNNSVNFMKGFFKITEYLDLKYGLLLTKSIKKEISKYSYPVLSIQRDKGLSVFFQYIKRLKNEIGISKTLYFHLYVVSLTLMGRKGCNRIIIFIKKILGRTPRL